MTNIILGVIAIELIAVIVLLYLLGALIDKKWN